MSAVTPFLAQRYKAQAAGVALIRRILERESFPNGFTTAELYQIAVKEPAPADFKPFPMPKPPPPPPPNKKARYQQPKSPYTYPEHPEHPVRSIRFLKQFILPFLAGSKEIAMVRQPNARTRAAIEAGELQRGPGTRLTSSQVEFKWKVIPPEERPHLPTPKPRKSVVGEEVGVGVDFSHLNKRKQNARVGKVSREVEKLKAYSSFTAERDSLMERLEKDSELAIHLADRMKQNGNRGGLEEVLEQEKLVKRDRTRRGRSIASSDSNEYVQSQIAKIRELVAYKSRSSSRSPEVATS